jgi:ABC-type antimicrobial peptide transport system permease subunit
MTFAARAASDPADIVRSMRTAVNNLDPELPLFDTLTMEERIDDSLTIRRTPVLLASSFGIIALFLSAIGIYGVLAYSVALRTKEIGIRMALGSSTDGVFRLILREGVVILAIGFAIGLGGTLGMGRYLRSELYNTGPFDAIVLASSVAVLGVVALAACFLPAHRAMRVDPVTALRQE